MPPTMPAAPAEPAAEALLSAPRPSTLLLLLLGALTAVAAVAIAPSLLEGLKGLAAYTEPEVTTAADAVLLAEPRDGVQDSVRLAERLDADDDGDRGCVLATMAGDEAAENVPAS